MQARHASRLKLLKSREENEKMGGSRMFTSRRNIYDVSRAASDRGTIVRVSSYCALSRFRVVPSRLQFNETRPDYDRRKTGSKNKINFVEWYIRPKRITEEKRERGGDIIEKEQIL